MQQILKKLGFRDQTDVLVLNAPEVIRRGLEQALPVSPASELTGRYAFLMVFVRSLDEFMPLREELVRALAPMGHLWICYPKKTSKKYRSDLSRDVLWPQFGAFDLEPVSQFSIDEDWSAMRFRPVDEIRTMKRKTATSDKARKRIE